ncbi:DMT family transporter [Sphingomonas sp.]|uniref:DMT family transporter n=1 Tax=Sphingomonas sp. TaxID=28214 RepID=UPI001EB26DB4|nr:DMT family transporter [Sphingomonas sp.]MBX3595713.1 DMT family transporter [Sphingomonas sp.]
MRPAPPLLAFAVASLGIAIFSSMDAVMKGLVLALGAYNALAWRTMAGIVVSGIPYLLSRPARPRRAAMRLHLIRAAVAAVMALLFFWGLARVPMAQAIALSFIAPILALFLAALILDERITRTAIVATGLAFGGVLLILWGQARAEMGHAALMGAIAILASACCYAWNIVLMRQQALIAGPAEIAFYQSLFVALAFLIGAPFLLEVPAIDHAPALIGAAVLATVSLFLLSWAYARAQANYLAPTEYTGFLWATMWGWLVFGEHVSFFTVAGAALIVGGCIIAAQRRDLAPVADTEAQLP